MFNQLKETEGLEAILKLVEKKKVSLPSLARAMKDYIDESPQETDGFLEGLDCTADQAKAVFDDLLLFITQCDDLYMEGEG